MSTPFPLTKFVPLGPALFAISAEADKDGVPDYRGSDFCEWYTSRRDNHLGEWIDLAWIAAPQVPSMLAQVPDDHYGRVWRAAVEKSIALTDADAYAPFDEVTLPAEIAEQLNALSAKVEERSPMLSDVAGAIALVPGTSYRFGAHDLAPVDISEVYAYIDGVDDGTSIVTNPRTPERERERGDGYYDEAQIPWSDVELLMPGLRDEFTSILNRIRDGLPDPAILTGGRASRGDS